MKYLRLASLLALFAAGPSLASLAAQVGTTTDVLTGVVKDDRGQPVAEAVIEATSLETQVTRTAKTDLRGRYTLLFPDGGGQYRLTPRHSGKAIDVSNCSTANGVKVQQWTWLNNNCQKFRRQ